MIMMWYESCRLVMLYHSHLNFYQYKREKQWTIKTNIYVHTYTGALLICSGMTS
jgi:hypothetical protein